MNLSKSLFFFNFSYKNLLFFIVIALNFQKISSQDFQAFTPNILEEDSDLLEVKDYENVGFIVTKKNLYSRLNMKSPNTFSSEFPSNSVFATYDESYLLTACTTNSLFGFLNVSSLVEETIYEYSDLGVQSNRYTCSISYLYPNVFVVHSKPTSAIILTIIRIKLKMLTNGLYIDGSSQNFTKEINLVTSKNFKYISCEAIFSVDSNDIYVLICGHILHNEYTGKTLYVASSFFINPTNEFNENVQIFESEHSITYNIKLKRINDTYIRYIVGTNSFEIYLKKVGSNYAIKVVSEELRNQYLYSFHSTKELFDYDNQYIFHAALNEEINTNYNLYVTNSMSNNNLISIAIDKSLKKVSGFYHLETDQFVYIYQYSNTIEYIILQYKCFLNAWHIDNNNSIVCYDNQNYCQSNQYYYHIDTRQCKLSNCNDGYYRFNFECYKDNCPPNTQELSSGENICESTLDYVYIDLYYKSICDNNPNFEYPFRYENSKIFLRTCEDSEYFFNVKTYTKTDIQECVSIKQDCIDNGYKIFNYLCFKTCQENTEPDGDNCICKYHYYINNELLYCLSQEERCVDTEYPISSNTNECFMSKISCISKGNKFFNNICQINSCPENTYEKNNDGDCFCLYSYYYNNDTNTYICLGNNETCESRGYMYNILEECFTSLDECKTRGKKIFNNKCYNSCPENTIISENDISSCICRNYYFYFVEQDLYDCFSNDKICITANNEYQYTNIETKECFKSINDCLQKGGDNTKCIYYDVCDPSKDYLFNNECYKNNCPIGTMIDPSNPSSKNCICVESSEIDPITGKIICIQEIPDQHITDKDHCPYIYNGQCIMKCPEYTCLNPNLKELINCVDVTDNIKVYNNICIEGINEMITKIIINDNYTNIKPIQTPSGISINAYPSEISEDIYIENFPKLTYVELGNCKNKLIAQYHLPIDTELYILGIDTPNLYGNSSINIFNYEIYLKNGTQLKDLSACNETKIIKSSNIIDLEIIKYDKALKFSKEGYDIYDRSNKFYVDNCASANDNGNDITLEDRLTYYYPNVSICNEGCNYNSIDFDSKRFICQCNVYLNEDNFTNSKNGDENKVEDETYLEYFLSLINYKIVKCYQLFYDFKNFYYNGGLYIGTFIFTTNFILIFIFCIKTVNSIKIDLFKNMPTKEKLKEIIRANLKQRKNNNSKDIINYSAPQKTNRNIQNNAPLQSKLTGLLRKIIKKQNL